MDCNIALLIILVFAVIYILAYDCEHFKNKYSYGGIDLKYNNDPASPYFNYIHTKENKINIPNSNMFVNKDLYI